MQIVPDSYWGHLEYSLQFTLFLILLCFIPFLMSSCAKTTTVNMDQMDITMHENWSGDYPVSELGRLPEKQQDLTAGYIGDTETFIPVWRAFMPKEILPLVDFSKNIVVYTRNTRFYNRKSIISVRQQNGIAEIIAMETRTAMPIEEKVAMAMAVIPRQGVKAIKAGDKTVQVKDLL